MKLRVKRLDTGAEFDFESDCYAHGVASFRVGMARRDCPFKADPESSFWQSWVAGYEVARNLAKSRTTEVA